MSGGGRLALWTLSGNAMYALSQLGVLVAFTKWSSPEELGIYAVALAITAPVHLGLGMRLRTARVVADASQFALSDYLRLALVMSGTAMLVSVAVGALVMTGSAALLTVALVALGKSVESLIDVTYGEMQRRERMRDIAGSQILRGVATIGVASTVLALGGGAAAVAGGLAVGWFLQLLAHELPRARASSDVRTPAGPPGSRVAKLARLAWPLGLAAGLTSLNGVSPRLVGGVLLEAQDIATLAVFGYAAMVLSLLANSLGQAQLSRLRTALEARDTWLFVRSCAASAAAVSAAGLAACTVLQLWGDPLLSILFAREYGEQHTLAVVVTGAATLDAMTTVAYYALTSTGRFGWHPVANIAALAVGVSSMAALAQRQGLEGLVWGIVIGSATQLVVMAGLAVVRCGGILARGAAHTWRPAVRPHPLRDPTEKG